MGPESAATEFSASLAGHGRNYAAKHDAFRAHWRSHLENSEHRIMEGARLARPDSVVVLGASDGKDIPLPGLLATFASVRLVDIDRESLERAVASLSAPDRARCALHCMDITGGAIAALTAGAKEIIENAATAKQAYRELVVLFEELPITENFSQSIAKLRSSYVVSSVVSSQLQPIPERWIAEKFDKHFGVPLAGFHSEKLERARNYLSTMLQRQHARLLAQLAPGGVVYWSCDVRQELVIGKLSSAETQRLGERTAEFLRKFDWDHVLPGESGGAVGSGEFAASITALIGRGVLPAPTEIEIIEFMIQQAQSINPAVTESLLEEGLASSFENYLLAKDPPRHWLWHLDPSLFYRGGVHRVESWLLGVSPGNQRA